MKLSVLLVTILVLILSAFFYPKLQRMSEAKTDGYRLGTVGAGGILVLMYLLFREPMFLNLF